MWTVVAAKCNGSWGTNETVFCPRLGVGELRAFYLAFQESTFIYPVHLTIYYLRSSECDEEGGAGCGSETPAPRVRMIHEARKET